MSTMQTSGAPINQKNQNAPEIPELYEAYVRAAQAYLEKPTGKNWEKKEEALEQFNAKITHYPKEYE